MTKFNLKERCPMFAKILCVLALLFILPSLSMAAYQNPTITANTSMPDGSGGQITFQFTGNAGEPVVTRIYQVSAATTATAVRNWVDDTIKELDAMWTAKTIPSAQAGQTVTRLARVNNPQTPKQIWNEKLQRYIMYRDSGITNATFTSNLNALKTDLDATYQAGFID
jgi:hypothetical protein